MARRVLGLALAAGLGFLAGLAVPWGNAPAPALAGGAHAQPAPLDAEPETPVLQDVREERPTPPADGAGTLATSSVPVPDLAAAGPSAAALVVGIVLDTEGRPAVGVKVAVWPLLPGDAGVAASVRGFLDASMVESRSEVLARAKTAPDGSFAVAVPADRPVRIAAANAGLAVGIEVRPVAGTNPPVVLRFVAPPPPPAISGTVWDDEGHRVAGAVVRAHAANGPVETITDAEGRFTLPPLGRALSQSGDLRVEKPGFEQGPFLSARSGVGGEVEIVLSRATPAARVRGTVRMADGGPIPEDLEILATIADADPDGSVLPDRLEPHSALRAFQALLMSGVPLRTPLQSTPS